MKALDIVRVSSGSIGFITETNNEFKSASVDFIKTLSKRNDKTAWYYESELEVIDSIPRLLAKAMAHPFGSGVGDAEKAFKTE